MPFHIKYRPTTLDDFVGNQVLVRSLSAVLASEAPPQAYLFTGPSGCGKTTLARIVAQSLGVSDFDFQEVDSADFRGVDHVREVRRHMVLAPAKGKRRAWLLDECFAAGTLIETPDGAIPIETFQPGQAVYSLVGLDRIKACFANRIPLSRLVRVVFDNGVTLFCSKEHLFYTDIGWVPAAKLTKNHLTFPFACYNMANTYQRSKGETDGGNQALSGMRSNDAVLPWQKTEQEVLQSILSCKRQEHQTRDKKSIVQPGNAPQDIGGAETVLAGNQGWADRAPSTFRKDDSEKSYASSRSAGESKGDETSQRDLECLAGHARGQRKIDHATADIGDCLGLADRSGCPHEPCTFEQKRVSHQLQGRHRQPQPEIGNRDRRTVPQRETSDASGCQKGGQAQPVRVDRIEIYQPRYNDESFAGVIGNTERATGLVTLYDLEVEKHPSYFANGLPVHNCHKLTNEAQNALLKALEDTPAHVIFLLATTDPEKLLPTVRNRCSTFTVQPLTRKKLVDLMIQVCQKERKRIHTDVLGLLAEKAFGSARAALVMLEQIIDLPREQAEQAAQEMEAQLTETESLVKALLDRKGWPIVRSILVSLGDDPEGVRRRMAAYAQAMILKNAPQAKRAFEILEELEDPFTLGMPNLVMVCYRLSANDDVSF